MALVERFRANHIGCAFPRQTLHIVSEGEELEPPDAIQPSEASRSSPSPS